MQRIGESRRKKSPRLLWQIPESFHVGVSTYDKIRSGGKLHRYHSFSALQTAQINGTILPGCRNHVSHLLLIRHHRSKYRCRDDEEIQKLWSSNSETGVSINRKRRDHSVVGITSLFADGKCSSIICCNYTVLDLRLTFNCNSTYTRASATNKSDRWQKWLKEANQIELSRDSIKDASCID